MRDKIYESDDVDIIADLFDDAKGVVVALSTFEEAEWKVQSFGDGMAQKRGYCGIFVRSKSNHWWQTPDRAEICSTVKAAAARFDNRIAYGTSMGAYGALSMGSEMGCTRILAIAPQTIISDPNIPLSPEWSKSISQRPILYDDVSDRLTIVPEIFYDPYCRIDKDHVAYLRDRKKIREYTFPFAGHKLLNTMRDSGIISQFISLILSGSYDEYQLSDLYTSNCAKSYHFHYATGVYHAKRGNLERAREALKELERLGHGDSKVSETLKTLIDARSRAIRPSATPAASSERSNTPIV